VPGYPSASGDGEPQATGILNNTDTLVGDIKEDDGGSENAAVTNDLPVDYIADADQKKMSTFFKDALEPDFAGKLLIRHSDHQASYVVNENKCN
jgi:hypothetical protein